MAFFNTAAELTRQYKQNRDDVEALYFLLDKTNKEVKETKAKVDDLSARVDDLSARVDELDTKVNNLGPRFDGRFDRIEQLVAHRPDERTPPSSQAVRTPPQPPFPRSEALVVPVGDPRFDNLASQVSEVLSILRAKSA